MLAGGLLDLDLDLDLDLRVTGDRLCFRGLVSSASLIAGFRVAMRTLDPFRPRAGAFAAGMALAAIDAAVQIRGARALRRGHLLEHL